MYTLKEVKSIVKISEGNNKIGDIPNMSLTPGKTCSACACKTCLKEGCYALKSYKLYPEVKKSWDYNTALATGDLASMETALDEYFNIRHDLDFFRIHVGGDFVSREYAAMWARIARKHENTRFLAFTKQWDHVRGIDFPGNFSLVLSGWTGTKIPDDLAKLYPCAYVIGKDDAVPAGAELCPGSCETCNMCWFLKRTGLNIAFRKH